MRGACEAAAKLGWVGSNRFANRPVCAPGDFPVTFLPADRTQSRRTVVPSAVSAAVARMATAGGTIPSRLLSSSSTQKALDAVANPWHCIERVRHSLRKSALPQSQLAVFRRRPGRKPQPGECHALTYPAIAPCGKTIYIAGLGARGSRRRTADGAKRRPPSLLCPFRRASLRSVRPTRLTSFGRPTKREPVGSGSQGVGDESDRR
jgi:hypothetical protein